MILLGQYIPKGANSRLLTDEQLAQYQQRLNQRPGKYWALNNPVLF